LQKRAVRIIVGVPYCSHSEIDPLGLYVEYKLLKFPLIQLSPNISKLMFCAIRNL